MHVVYITLTVTARNFEVRETFFLKKITFWQINACIIRTISPIFLITNYILVGETINNFCFGQTYMYLCSFID